MTRYLAMVSWFLLLLWEFMQLISKILSRRLREYFSWQNITEVTMISLTAAFFIIFEVAVAAIIVSILFLVVVPDPCSHPSLHSV